jgi:putative oxygen-independent coproporphyrinogen III oxidase
MQYLDALEREMELTVKQYPPDGIETIFVGGGTPTVLLPDQMEHFLKLVRTYFFHGDARDEAIEFTMEANPGTTDADKLKVMKAGGVNRISFGVQSFDSTLLAEIGRIHNVDDVYRSIDNARQAGFNNLSIDLMFGLPKQTIAMMQQTLDAALKLDLQHYSIYGLKVEENTLFHTLFLKNQLALPDEDEEVQMYVSIMERLHEAGYLQYEISNFAKPGYESRHNMMYWRNQSYYGLGAGAHGYMHQKRHVNVKAIQPYIDAANIGLPRSEEEHEVSRGEAMEDFMMVGLRMLRGVNNTDFKAQFGVSMESVFGEILEKLTHKKLLTAFDGGYRLSEQGILLGNEVFAEFIGIFA